MSDFELDVRPVLRDGGEPFGAIMGAVAGLAPGQRLKLIAPFKPEPLFKVMTSKGFSFDASPLEGGDWQVIFTLQTPELVSGVSSPENPDSWAEPSHYLDLADLDPPEPMVRILGQLAQMTEGEVAFALLAREPVFLFAELTARGHAWAGDLDETGNVYRLMIRAGAPK